MNILRIYSPVFWYYSREMGGFAIHLILICFGIKAIFQAMFRILFSELILRWALSYTYIGNTELSSDMRYTLQIE